MKSPVPEHLTIPPSITLWQQAVEYRAEQAGRRADWRRGLMALVWQLMLRSDYYVTTPRRGATWDILAAELGCSRRALAYKLAWLREQELLVTITPGSTVRFRPGTRYGRIDDGLGNLAAEYALTIPVDMLDDAALAAIEADYAAVPAEQDEEEVPWPVETVRERPAFMQVNASVEETCTPAPGVDLQGEAIPTHAREMSDSTPPSPSWSATVTPGTKKEILAACERLRADNPPLRVVSAKDLRSLLRALFAAGATVRDVYHVLNVRPDGQRWGDLMPPLRRPHYERCRILRAMIRHRLSWWMTDDGELKHPLPSQEHAAAEARRHAEQERFRLQVLEPVRTVKPGDAAQGLAAARAALASTEAGAAALEKAAARQVRRPRWAA
ncbi:hypothetical protein Ppa06_57260 [Planomonospora parontospora subsp. parontospora]|uniref:Uncharacterized protein n=2 Tax=Planomonospora parontospora TaxID=58119 RepID=A0AA37BMD3_9ACTN|nr:hypothetical protein [Planomonospora parontospora]GGK90979.1 hypothetical protein GCM10010126_58040 [Planomonospora parontospora]GII11928.1 hypothetical protein Ppa06_57260 [Planomonospora parontospora subsp. parontospora]